MRVGILLHCLPTGTSESDTPPDKSGCGTHASSASLKAIEAVMEPATFHRFNDRYSKGYDVPGDELYEVWVQLKKLCISSKGCMTYSTASDVCQLHRKEHSSTEEPHDTEDLNSFGPHQTSVAPPQTSVAPAFLEILTYPGAVKKKPRSKDPVPSHLNSAKMIQRRKKVD